MANPPATAAESSMPPPSPTRETRRSGRRSGPSTSSNSKSPESQTPPSAPGQSSRRPSLKTGTSNNGAGRSRRPKQEDIDDADARDATLNGAAHAGTNGRAKRKGRDKDKDKASGTSEPPPELPPPVIAEDVLAEAPEEEEEQGITRCVCGSTEDDPDAGEFMVQCETCNCWQHGLCMGFEAEDQLPDDDYHCEQCRPDMHVELLKKLSKKARHSSSNSHHTSAAAARMSRSHSPSTSKLQPPAKRRNTMNSRDAAFDESLEEIIKATAREAEHPPGANGGDAEEEVDLGRRKRKRTDEDAAPKKRTRSASAVSDRPGSLNLGHDDASINGDGARPVVPMGPPPKAASSRAKRGGGRKTAVVQDILLPEGEEGVQPPAPAKRSHARKPGGGAKRPSSSKDAANNAHDHGTRRNQTNGVNGSAPANAESGRAYRNSHAYAVSQQALFTSWHLPDYLAHLEEMLPSDVPAPLDVRGAAGAERTTERGVKVKWPSKRTSVGDMNKRVRALVEWVSREQNALGDRAARREALEKVMRDTVLPDGPEGLVSEARKDADGEAGNGMILDGSAVSESPAQEKTLASVGPHAPAMDVDAAPAAHPSTQTMMEDLMQELLAFQERFGPGSKRDRDRR